MQSNTLKSVIPFSLMIIVATMLRAQPSEPRMSKVDYIETYGEQAVREMHASGVPASITLAQGMLESDYGNSPLAKYANNHFGIKCHKGWEGPTFIQDDDEANECFRKYYDAYDSYRDHSEFLRTRDRYAFLFDLKTTDYKGWARGLKKAGYATNPKYADLLIRIIEDNELYRFDQIVTLPETEQITEVPAGTAVPDAPQVLSVRAVEVSDNNIKYVLAEAGDTPERLADRYNMGRWQILKYNDLSKKDVVMAGEVIYLQPKRNYATQSVHVVAAGESLRAISQQHGVKMKRLLKMNDLPKDYVPAVGDTLKLRDMGFINSTLTGR